MRRAVVIAAITIAAQAHAAQAFLVRTSIASSVTGQPIVVCTYQYMRQTFERYYQMGTMCPSAIEIR